MAQGELHFFSDRQSMLDTVPAPGSPGLARTEDDNGQADFLTNAVINDSFGHIAYDVAAAVKGINTILDGLKTVTVENVVLGYAPNVKRTHVLPEQQAEIDELVSTLDIVAVDTEQLAQGICNAITLAINWGYLAGRLDQLSDLEGTNGNRFVRARDLSKVIADALDFDGASAFRKDIDFVSLLATQRNRLKEERA